MTGFLFGGIGSPSSTYTKWAMRSLSSWNALGYEGLRPSVFWYLASPSGSALLLP